MAKKKRVFPSQSAEAFVALLKTADRVKTFAAKTFEPYGITAQQYNVLRILRGAEPEGLPVLTIAERMIERTPGMTRMIDRLEAKGLANRCRVSKDRRCVHCRITPKGIQLLAKLDDPVEITNKGAFAGISTKERTELIGLLTLVRQHHEAS